MAVHGSLTCPTLESIEELMQDGLGYAEIGERLGCSKQAIYRVLDAADPLRSARAKADSAEGWLDRGLAVIGSALDKSGNIDANAARAYAQECARRAFWQRTATLKMLPTTPSTQMITIIFLYNMSSSMSVSSCIVDELV